MFRSFETLWKQGADERRAYLRKPRASDVESSLNMGIEDLTDIGSEGTSCEYYLKFPSICYMGMRGVEKGGEATRGMYGKWLLERSSDRVRVDDQSEQCTLRRRVHEVVARLADPKCDFWSESKAKNEKRI